MSLFKRVSVREAPFLPAINTGTTLDIATGSYVPGVDECHILNGGFGLTNGTTGRPQMFKSTVQIGHAVNAYARCPGADFLVYDTERTLQEKRILGMSDIAIPETNSFKLTTRAEYYAEEFFETVRAMAHAKLSAIKDYTVEIPHLDPLTGKAQRMLIPTFIGIDSWSNMEAKVVADTLMGQMKLDDDGSFSSKTSITSSDTNTAFMKDGLAKKKIIRELNSLAEKAGLYMFFTAHIGEKIEMNPYAPTPKTLQHMKMSDKPKGVGADFMFLMMNLLDCRSAKALINDSDKKSLYPTKDGYTSPADLNELTQVVTRCKGNASGTQIKSVVSQSEGLNPTLSNYHYLKENKYWGFNGNPMRHAPLLMPENILQRTTVNDKLRAEPRLARAIEILSQLYFIQQNWTLRGAPVPFSITPQELADKLFSSGYAIDDILDSRGWWTYEFNGAKNTQPYLSLYDILAITEGAYKPKFLSVKSSPNLKVVNGNESKKDLEKAA